jgi:mannose-6-phosphate isomerase-like protein (cupin superfamily)
MRFVIIGITLTVFALFAADPAGFNIWKGSYLKGQEKTLAAKMTDKVATENLAKYSNHLVMVAHREGDGQAEFHEKQIDVFIVESGEATLVVGGTMPNSKTTAPNEIRAPSIVGGEKKVLGPGDIVHIPVKTPHQVLVEPGKQFTYAVVKVDVE